MILLTIGSDRNLFKRNSDVWNRYLDYGKLFEEIHIVVFSHKKLNNKKTQIGNNVFIYPTNHRFKFFYLWNIYRIVKKIIRNLKLEIRNCRDKVVITAQDPFESGLAGWIVKKLFKIPLQIQIHTDFLSPYFWKESLMNKIRVLLAKFIIPQADSIRVVSERIKQSLIRNWKLEIRNFKIDVLPIFIDVEAIRNAPIKVDLHKKYPQFDFIILIASRLSKEKNIGMAIEAMAELVKKHPKLGLVIVGSGPEEVNLKFKIISLRETSRREENLKLNNHIIFEGWAENLASYYKTTDLFLLTSNYEGYGRSVVEVMSAKLPVVMTDVGLAKETIISGENGVVIPVGDNKALVDNISLLIYDKNKRDGLSASAVKTIEKLFKKEEYLKLYKKSIESCAFNH